MFYITIRGSPTFFEGRTSLDVALTFYSFLKQQSTFLMMLLLFPLFDFRQKQQGLAMPYVLGIMASRYM
jgi:hypothetical protein